MLKLWGRATSLNVQKVVWALEEIGVAYERVDVGGRHGGLDQPAYIARNPNQRIPTVEDDGTVVWESNAVVRYVAARYSEGQLWDRDPGRRAQADQWMDWMQTTLAPDFYAVFWGVVRTLPQKQDKAAIAAHLKSLGERFAVLDRQLDTGPSSPAISFRWPISSTEQPSTAIMRWRSSGPPCRGSPSGMSA